MQQTSEVLRIVETTTEGLTPEQVSRKRERYGFNELPEKKRSLLFLFLQQFQDIMVYILLGALAFSIITPFLEGHEVTIESFLDAAVIGVILLLNAVLGFVQEYKAEEAIAGLKKLTSPHTRVRRNGKEEIIASRDLLPGDIVIIEAGDRISADGRILECSHLQVNESSLTGESVPVTKQSEALEAETTQLAEQTNMLFSGTLVAQGYAEYVVTATGLNTEIGKIAKLVAETALPETPLQKRLEKLGKTLGVIVLSLCALIIVVGLLKGMSIIEITLLATTLAVSAVPEGLPAVVTVAFAIGVRRMAKQQALVRRLESLETLGSVTIICADKTGTITENRMTVQNVWVNSSDYTNEQVIQIAASCNRAELPNIGDPTEVGLLVYADNKQVKRLEIDEEIVPFTSKDKYMKTRHGDRIFLKGAPEVIFEMSDDESESILKQNEELAKQGLRVLACAEQKGDSIQVVGLIAMEDPPREGVKHAIEEARNAGIRTIMITGDNIITASTIAENVGITGDAMLGVDIDSLSEEELIAALKTVSVFARVTPEHKLRILHALQTDGNIVAMSGDGVNDAPALKGAHVGIAMGKVGTEVARESSSIVLANDHYSTIVLAIKEGRRIYDNIRKFVIFLLRANFDELLLITTTIIIGIPVPYLPLHILWINLMTDSLPALALSMEPAEKNVMKRPPRKATEHLLDGEWIWLAISSMIGFLVSLFFFTSRLNQGMSIELARSETLTLAILFEIFLASSVRSSQPIWKIGLFSNKWMIGATIVPLIAQIVLLYTPLKSLFYLESISLVDWIQIAVIALIPILSLEVLKVLFPSRRSS